MVCSELSWRGPQCVNFPWHEWGQLRGGGTLSAEGGAERGHAEPRVCLLRVRLQDSTRVATLLSAQEGGESSLDIRMLFHLPSRSEQMTAVESSSGGPLLCSAPL